MRRRFEGLVEESQLVGMIALQVEHLQSAAEDGVVLLATYAQGKSEGGLPPAGLSLTLALANRPSAEGNPDGVKEKASSLENATFTSEAKPLVLDDPEMTALISERRTEVSIPGVERPFEQFQAQAFVLPNDQAGMAVVTVTTFHPDFEDEARETARRFANTLCFATGDDEESDARRSEGEEPPPTEPVTVDEIEEQQ